MPQQEFAPGWLEPHHHRVLEDHRRPDRHHYYYRRRVLADHHCDRWLALAAPNLQREPGSDAQLPGHCKDHGIDQTMAFGEARRCHILPNDRGSQIHIENDLLSGWFVSPGSPDIH